MPILAITFPVFDPIAFSIGWFVIRWYALAYIGGIVLGWIYARSLVKKERLWGGPVPITLVQLDDFILWVTIGIIVGGRTGYVLFYNPVFFIQHPAEIFQLWNGGMSFHGGFLGCVAAVMLFARKNGYLDPVARRHHHRGRTDRTVSRPARQLHQQRAVGSNGRFKRAMGDGVSQWRAAAAAPEPAL
jgi:prolipoprotein diacylglyceryl transferase